MKVPEAEITYAVVDIESTGFDLYQDRILSIALGTIKESKLPAKNVQEWIVYQKEAILNEAVKVHGILPSQTNFGSTEADVLKTFIPLISGTILVGHHIRFDAAMLNKAMERNFGMKLRNKLLDTATMSMVELDAFKSSGYSNQKPPSLDEVCSQMEINTVDRHTASGDVFTTAQLFLMLKAKIKQRTKGEFTVKKLPVFRF